MVLVLLAVGCSGSDETAGPADVATVLATTAEAMAEVGTVAFTIERTGAAVFLDEGGSLVFNQAKGRFSSEGAAVDAVLRVTALGIETQMGAVSV